MIVLGLVPKIGALVDAMPVAVLGGAGPVVFEMAAAAGVSIFSRVDFALNRFNELIVAISLGMGIISLNTPDIVVHLPHSIHLSIDPGILLALIFAVAL